MKTKLTFLLLFSIFQFIFGQEISGSWKGELNIQGNKLPLIFHITKAKDGYQSTLDSPLQKSIGIPVDITTFGNNNLSLEIKALNAKYQGTLKDEKISGKFTQNGLELPLALTSEDSQNTNIENYKFSQNLDESVKKINLFLDYLENKNYEGGAISIFKNGREVYQRKFGQENLPQKDQNPQTLQIGSITKTMTAIMLFQLIEKKQLSLNDKLAQYFPEIPNAQIITISQMLNHTSGLGDYAMGPQGDERWLQEPKTEKQILDKIKEQGSLFKPGEKVQYSNSAYYLLTKILEKITKKTYQENLRERIINPLQLKDFYTAGEKPQQVAESFTFTNKWIFVKDFDFNNVVGVGDIATNPNNLNIIINAFFNGKLVSKSSIEQMLPKNEDNFGRGIMQVDFLNKKYLGHSGGTYGTYSFMLMNKDDNFSISYSLNAPRVSSKNFITYITNILYNKDFEYPKFNETALSEADLQKYTGEYSSKSIPLGLKIFIKDGILFAQGTGQPEFPLEYVKDHIFTFNTAGLKIIFNPEKQEFELYQKGSLFQFSKNR